MVSFDKSFKPEIDENTQRMFDVLIVKAIRARQHLDFKKYKDGLYVADPFMGFIGDCEFCKHYYDVSNLTTGGRCLLHYVNCGYGFTCADNTSEYKIDVGDIND